MNYWKWGIACTLAMAAVGTAIAQTNSPSTPGKEPGRPNKWGYAYPHALDAEIAAPLVHRMRYEDDHIQFLEVVNPPGYQMQMHGHPYPSVFARMSGAPGSGGGISNTVIGAAGGGGAGAVDIKMDPNSPQNGQGWRNGPPPKGEQFPVCTSADPQAPHKPSNGSDTPLHFHRIEFKRVDEEAPERLNALYAGRKPEVVRYQDAAVRLVEVTVQPGKTLPRKAHSLPGVLAFDSLAAFGAVDTAAGDKPGRSQPPAGMTAPRCITLGRDQMPAFANTSDRPLHFYWIEFRRIDGTGLHDHWREWYPYMVSMLQGAK